jgi:hypothetical protein
VEALISTNISFSTFQRQRVEPSALNFDFSTCEATCRVYTFAEAAELEAQERRLKARRRDLDLGVFIGFPVARRAVVTGEDNLSKLVNSARDGRSDEEIERDVEKIINNRTRRPHSYFDPTQNWIAPDDTYESDTPASFKTITAALNKANKNGDALTNDLYNAAERLLYKYHVFISEGIRERIARHNDVSWYLIDGPDDRAFISYQDGKRGEWQHGCYADEVPLWLLMALFRRIKRRKPLGDQRADDTIKKVDDLDEEFRAFKQRGGSVCLNVERYSGYTRRPGNGE